MKNMVLWAYGVAHRFFTAVIGVQILAGAVKFDIANRYVKVPSGSNRLLCPPYVLYVLYYHQPLPCALVTSCHVLP